MKSKMNWAATILCISSRGSRGCGEFSAARSIPTLSQALDTFLAQLVAGTPQRDHHSSMARIREKIGKDLVFFIRSYQGQIIGMPNLFSNR